MLHLTRLHPTVFPMPADTVTAPHQFLYVSRLAPGHDSAVVARILEVSRRRNRELRLSGILVFDGEYFAQLLEGQRDAVQPLARRIEHDTRHVAMQVLYDGPTLAPQQNQLGQWLAGYAEPDELAPLLQLQGEAALAMFLSLAPRFDLSA